MQSGKKHPTRLLPILFCTLAILLVACGSPATPQSGPTGSSRAPANKQIAIVPEEGISDIATFDPAITTDFSSEMAIQMVFTGLVQVDDNGRVLPQLAASYHLESDGLTWTFTLRPNLKFSDGTPLTSQDVAYSIDRALQPATKSNTAPIYLALVKDSDKLVAGKIKTIIGDSLLTPDPNTIKIIANKKAAYFLDALTYPTSFVVEKSLVVKYGNTKFTDHLTEGGGDGPWKVAEYTHGKQIVFVPNANYYDPKPQMRKVIFPFYKSADTTYKAYQVNQVDVTTTISIPTPDLPAARALPAHQLHQVPQLWISYLTMNYLVKPFDNIKIRQAFELALNKDLIAHDIYKDTVIATNHIVPQGMPGYNADLTGPGGVKATSGNPTLARQLFAEGLAEEGLTAATLPPITVTYSSGGSNDIRNELAAQQQMWQNVLGVSVKLDDIDFNRLLTESTAATNNPKGLMAWELGWLADYPDPQDWTTLQFDKGVPNNNSNYGQNNTSDASIQQQTQQALEAADSDSDTNSRLHAYYQAEQQLVNDVAWAPVYQVALSYLQKPCVVGFTIGSEGLIAPNDWASIYKSTDPNCADTSSYQ